jgi:hypothetical protein
MTVSLKVHNFKMREIAIAELGQKRAAAIVRAYQTWRTGLPIDPVG